MKLLVVSHTPHHLRDGQPVGWGATVRELDYLAGLFDEVTHVAPLHPGPAPESGLAYCAPNMRLRAVAPAGGERLRDKVSILALSSAWARTIADELRRADVVHVRCPASISLVALAVLALTGEGKKRWIKYAGNWRPESGEPLSYRLQRWWLARPTADGVVTVNGRWLSQPAHVRPFLNPCLTEAEIAGARQVAAGKRLTQPVRILFVGRLDEDKGTGRVLDVMAALRSEGIDATADLAGDGPQRRQYERRAEENGLAGQVRFHGWLAREALNPLYADAHFALLPSRTEGWPKVLSEAMAYGALPLASAVSSVPQLLQEFGAGRAIRAGDTHGFARAIAWYASHPEEWHAESTRAICAAEGFSYANYQRAVRAVLDLEPAPELAAPASARRMLLSAPARPMHICFVGYMVGRRAGYVTSQGLIVSRLLEQAGYLVTCVSSVPNRVLRMLDTVLTLLCRLWSADVVVVETYSGPSFFLADVASGMARLFGRPVVLVLHGGALPEFSRRFPRWTRRVLARASHLVAPSPYLARLANQLRLKVQVIPNVVVRLGEYPYRRREEVRPRLFWMRAFHEIYNPLMAVRVLGRLRAVYPDATLIMAGQDKGELGAVQQFARACGLEDVVRFPGFLDFDGKTREAFRCDVCINTNRVDNMPVAVVEACAMGLPVVATSVGGIRDLLTDGETGLIVPDGDDRAMADAVASLVENAALAAKLSENGRALAMRSSWEQVQPQWAAVFAKVSR